MVRVGIGYDVHRFEPGRRLVLGGVLIPHEVGLAGYSDADVLLHAVMDAMLGAAGLGDIGEHFPPGDERFQGVDSRILLQQVCGLLGGHWQVVHVDVTVIAEAPRLGPYRQQIRETLAGILGIPDGSVNVKATTNEGLGFVGRGEGIAALAAVTLDDVVGAPG